MSHSAPLPRRPSPRSLWIAGAVVCVLLVLGVWLMIYIITGKGRAPGSTDPAGNGTDTPAGTVTTSTAARTLDGVLVESSVRSLRPWAMMIDNQIDARPQEGLSSASVVMEAPVEGGITRLLAVFDPTTTSTGIGPVRSARPYFVDWAEGYKAVFAHVGGSPEALDRLARIPSSTVLNIDEMVKPAGFLRTSSRPAPHHVLTSGERFRSSLGSVTTSTVAFRSWRYTSATAPSSTTAEASSIRIPYGGSYSVRWTYDATLNAYRRSVAVKQNSKEPIFATNVVVIKTDASILDAAGRLKLRTTGSGEAIIYRDGKKFIGRWRRTPGEVIEFVGTDGVDLELRAGSTWIQVTTDDRIFAGLDAS